MSLWLYNKISLKTKCKIVVITCRPRRIVVHVLLHYGRFLWRERVSVPRLALHAPATVDCVTIHWQWRARWVSRACSWRRTAQTHNLNLSLQVNEQATTNCDHASTYYYWMLQECFRNSALTLTFCLIWMFIATNYHLDYTHSLRDNYMFIVFVESVF